ncbi:MAG: hypothetical protein QW315_05190 [Candidatus Hadarchaeum sp.]
MRCSAGRKAASVLPVPAGEISRMFLPSSIFGSAACWGRVGSLKPISSSNLRMGLARSSKELVSRIHTTDNLFLELIT